MPALAPGVDPLIAEAKLRMRRRRVLMAALVLAVGAAVLFLILRPPGAPGTSGATHQGPNGNGNALARLTVPVDAIERRWLSGIKSIEWSCACGLTGKGQAQLRREVASVARKSGATVVRMRVWPVSGAVEAVLATHMDPATYLKHRVGPLFALDRHGFSYFKVVDGRGATIDEWYGLPHEDGGWLPKRLNSCAPNPIPYPTGSPPCPVK